MEGRAVAFDDFDFTVIDCGDIGTAFVCAIDTQGLCACNFWRAQGRGVVLQYVNGVVKWAVVIAQVAFCKGFCASVIVAND